MFIAALSGYLGSATSGYPVKFFGWVLPAWTRANVAAKDASSVLHLAVSWALTAAIVAHVLATAYHQWVLHDGLLWRMWPRRSSEPTPSPRGDAPSPATRPPGA
jgi:cytochrome b561